MNLLSWENPQPFMSLFFFKLSNGDFEPNNGLFWGHIEMKFGKLPGSDPGTLMISFSQ
jgi:hypothetical protein